MCKNIANTLISIQLNLFALSSLGWKNYQKYFHSILVSPNPLILLSFHHLGIFYPLRIIFVYYTQRKSNLQQTYSISIIALYLSRFCNSLNYLHSTIRSKVMNEGTLILPEQPLFLYKYDSFHKTRVGKLCVLFFYCLGLSAALINCSGANLNYLLQ